VPRRDGAGTVLAMPATARRGSGWAADVALEMAKPQHAAMVATASPARRHNDLDDSSARRDTHRP
jgi:hypothetical protein